MLIIMGILQVMMWSLMLTQTIPIPRFNAMVLVIIMNSSLSVLWKRVAKQQELGMTFCSLVKDNMLARKSMTTFPPLPLKRFSQKVALLVDVGLQCKKRKRSFLFLFGTILWLPRMALHLPRGIEKTHPWDKSSFKNDNNKGTHPRHHYLNEWNHGWQLLLDPQRVYS